LVGNGVLLWAILVVQIDVLRRLLLGGKHVNSWAYLLENATAGALLGAYVAWSPGLVFIFGVGGALLGAYIAAVLNMWVESRGKGEGKD
jgi:hypothetical protein